MTTVGPEYQASAALALMLALLAVERPPLPSKPIAATPVAPAAQAAPVLASIDEPLPVRPIRVIQIAPPLPSKVDTSALRERMAAAPPIQNYREPELPPHRYVQPDQPKKQAKKREAAEKSEPRSKRDICRGLGKKYSDNKRSWKCNRR